MSPVLSYVRELGRIRVESLLMLSVTGQISLAFINGLERGIAVHSGNGTARVTWRGSAHCGINLVGLRIHPTLALVFRIST
jgi:hypothetical protein